MLGATSEGTSRYTTRKIDEGFPPSAVRSLGRTGLRLMGIGFGAYRVGNSTTHREALKAALLKGCNLIDTSSNYTDGRSETRVGEVLKDLFSSNTLRRDEIIVITKGGYLQGSNLAEATQREQSGKPYPDMVKYHSDCWHCIHPDFISDQITQSLDRLGLEKIDCYLLHNPEYYLLHALNSQPDLKIDKIRELYYDRILRAFRKLEEEVESGRISHYGVSSNTFGKGIHEPDHTSLESLWEIACHVGKDKFNNPYQHHFSVAQFPANLLELGPMITPNCDEEKTALEYAKEKSVGVLVNRPLNAILGNHMIRLADMKKVKLGPTLPKQFEKVRHLEEEFAKTIAPKLDTGKNNPDAETLFAWGSELAHANLKSFGLEQWKHIEYQLIRPQINQVSQALDQQLTGDLASAWKEWKKRYLPELTTLIESIHSSFSERSYQQLKKLTHKLDTILPKHLENESLSRKSLAVLLNTSGISCVLNGMRELHYVEDSIGALNLENFEVDANRLKELAED